MNVNDDDSDSEESVNSASVGSTLVSCGKHALNIPDKMPVESNGQHTLLFYR